MNLRIGVLTLILGFGMVVEGFAQGPPPAIFWDDTPACGRHNLSVDPSLICCEQSVNEISSKARTIRIGKLAVSVTYWRFTNAIRLLTLVANENETEVPVNVKHWTLSAFRSYEAFAAGEKPLFMSRPEKPMVLVSQADIENQAGGSRLPTNEPLRTQNIVRPTFDQRTGRLGTSTVTTIVPDGTGPSSVPSIVGKAGASALKWTEVPASTRKVGEVTFATREKAGFHLLSLDVNGTVYIYMIGKPVK